MYVVTVCLFSCVFCVCFGPSESFLYPVHYNTISSIRRSRIDLQTMPVTTYVTSRGKTNDVNNEVAAVTDGEPIG